MAHDLSTIRFMGIEIICHLCSINAVSAELRFIEPRHQKRVVFKVLVNIRKIRKICGHKKITPLFLLSNRTLRLRFSYRAILSFGLSRLIVWLVPFDRLARAKKTGSQKACLFV